MLFVYGPWLSLPTPIMKSGEPRRSIASWRCLSRSVPPPFEPSELSPPPPFASPVVSSPGVPDDEPHAAIAAINAIRLIKTNVSSSCAGLGHGDYADIL